MPSWKTWVQRRREYYGVIGQAQMSCGNEATGVSGEQDPGFAPQPEQT
jgi:hypothetical protein